MMKRTAKGSMIGVAVLLAATGFNAAAQARSAPTKVPTTSHARGDAGATTAALLGSGYLSTNGNQIVDSTGKRVRISAAALHGMVDLDQTAIVNQDTPLAGLDANFRAIRAAGFNTVTLAWSDASLHDSKAAAYLAGIDAVVAAAQSNLLKVILNHHNDEGAAGNGNCLAQQGNGLWYDSGPGTNGTDGCGTPGTVTQASFLADWQEIATRYKGNATVIGFDLDNEPLAYTGESTWGDGGVTDIHAMYTAVGNAVETADPGVLVICEGPQNYGGSFAGGTGVVAPEGDLTAVAAHPVVLSNANAGRARVLYSVHEYPYSVAHITPDSGVAAVTRYNAVWGYLETQNIAPVWIGEAGAPMTSSDDSAWAATLSSYANGQQGANGGPTFTGTEQGINITWYVWDTQGLGALNADGTLNQARFDVYSQWQ
jgi:aryl-phospho-beta-D-glucosidase BglC (GH1 family)